MVMFQGGSQLRQVSFVSGCSLFASKFRFSVESENFAPVFERRKPTENGSLMVEDSKNVLADLLEISFSRKSWNFRADKA
jgi:hypothetical protein